MHDARGSGIRGRFTRMRTKRGRTLIHILALVNRDLLMDLSLPCYTYEVERVLFNGTCPSDKDSAAEERSDIWIMTIYLESEIMLMRLLLAALLGGLIGWERERRNKQAGLKTHLLVAVGSTLIMLTSIYGFDSTLINHPNARFDPARLSAQVVSGIGFLGAGAILRRSNNIISGLTTAATLWVAAAIGLSVGSGYYLPAVVTTIIVLLSTLVLNRFEARFLFIKKSGRLKITVESEDQPVEVSAITSLLHKANVSLEDMTVNNEGADGESTRVTMEFRVYSFNGKGVDELLEQLWKVEGIKQVRMNWRDKD